MAPGVKGRRSADHVGEAGEAETHADEDREEIVDRGHSFLQSPALQLKCTQRGATKITLPGNRLQNISDSPRRERTGYGTLRTSPPCCIAVLASMLAMLAEWIMGRLARICNVCGGGSVKTGALNTCMAVT